MKRDMKISVLERAGNPSPGTFLLRPKATSQRRSWGDGFGWPATRRIVARS